MTVLQTLPRAPEQSDKQTRLFIDMAGAILNAFIRAGLVVQIGPQDWQLVVTGTPLAALSVLGRAGNTAGGMAAITAASDHQVLRRSGTSIGFGSIDLSQSSAVTGDLAFANLVQASAASKLVGRGSASGSGDFQEITLGSNLSLSGTVLSASGGGLLPAASGEQVITTYSISASSGTWVNSGVSQLTLPDAGTYLVWANLRLNMVSTATSSYIQARLYDTTNSAVLSNTQRLLLFDGATLNEQLTNGLAWLVTTASANVLVDLSVARNGTFSSSQILSNSDGQSTFGYLQLEGGTLPLAGGGTGSILSDPGANKILAWDDTDNAVGFWTLGTGLTYTHSTHTLSVSGGGGGMAIGDPVTSGTPTYYLFVDGSGNLAQTSPNATANAILPSQGGNSGKVLGTDGTDTSWVSAGTGTVTSVDMSVPAELTVSGNPITASGTLAVTWSAASGNKFIASPADGSSGAYAGRAMVAADLPVGTGTVTSVDVSGGSTGLTTSGGPITTSGTITLAGTLAVTNGGTGQTSLAAHCVLIGAGTSNVTPLNTGTSGQALISGGASLDPAFGILGYIGGGTDQNNWSTGDLLYASNANTLSKLAIGTTGLAMLVNSAVPTWGVLGYAGGGTGQSGWSTGDLLYASGNNNLARLGAGNTGDVLQISGGVPAWIASLPYAAAVSGNWGGSAPTTLKDAIDRLAAWIAANNTVFTALGITTQP